MTKATGRLRSWKHLIPLLLGLSEVMLGRLCAQEAIPIPAGDPSHALVLLNHAIESEQQGRFAEAETHFREALRILDALAAPERPEVAVTLDELGDVVPGRKTRSAMVPEIVVILNEWGNLLRIQGRYREAEEFLRRAITIGERTEGRPALNLALSLNSLGDLYCKRNEPTHAVPLLARALEIREKALGPQDPLVAASLGNLADAFMRQGRLGEAEVLYQRALRILETTTEYAFSLAATNYKLAELYFRHWKRDSRRLSMAEVFYRRSLSVLEGHRTNAHGLLGLSMSALAELYVAERRYAEAEPLLIRALTVQEKTLGPEHPRVAEVLTTYASLLRKVHRGREAALLDKRAKSIMKTFKTENLAVRAIVDVRTLQAPR
jgi:tetratricopeptide (TPR) repeat protein